MTALRLDFHGCIGCTTHLKCQGYSLCHNSCSILHYSLPSGANLALLSRPDLAAYVTVTERLGALQVRFNFSIRKLFLLRKNLGHYTSLPHGTLFLSSCPGLNRAHYHTITLSHVCRPSCCMASWRASACPCPDPWCRTPRWLVRSRLPC